ncbi:6a9a4985-9ecf-4277-ba2b-d1195d088096 [Sclerotinia trifoliorum]|uniref:6a9a4985-9ecf-4277-ba2b-d1195d088096 n=1 Tax=Sclerotinia trifoliorum TaxID=28548 RepID=A0A8H2ZJW2_9HELO|nr:6a9a4985-9ecf-4277-ba2b-d1195d088096 [Sclerotinia trifoliorum]
MVNTAKTGPGIYSATYSNVPVYEYLFGEALKEHVMRRRHDDWINATHILKAAGFDKPARTRILEREVQKEEHEKIQGGYGKYQGTWVPLEKGQALAQRNNIYEKLRAIFEYTPGELSPPPAPKHATNKPKVKKPAVPKWGAMPIQQAAIARQVEENYDNIGTQLNDDESVADDVTVASASYMAEDDRFDMSRPPTGHRKRKRDRERDESQQDDPVDLRAQAHLMWADELLDYFMAPPADANSMDRRPEPPINFEPDFIIDTDGHTGLHWAASIGDLDILKQLKRFGANLVCRNNRQETPLMRSVLFTNSYDKQNFPLIVKELINTAHEIDSCGATVLHHAAATTNMKQKFRCAQYYLDVLLEKLIEIFHPDEVQRLLDARDINGNTAIHIAAKNKARKCVRALMGRGASTDILNDMGETAEEIIQDLNASRRSERHQQAASSSPFAPDSARHLSHYDALEQEDPRGVAHISEAAMTLKNNAEPILLERLHALACSFDEELAEKENAEADSRRILEGVRMELVGVREQARHLAEEEEGEENVIAAKAHLVGLQERVQSLVERQQQLLLLSRTQHEGSKINGHGGGQINGTGDSEDGDNDRILAAQQLHVESRRRKALVGEYIGALGVAGGGDEGELYKRVIVRDLGVDEGEGGLSDEGLDALIANLEEERGGVGLEREVGDEL